MIKKLIAGRHAGKPGSPPEARPSSIETIGGDVDASGTLRRPRLGSQHGLNNDGVRETTRVIYGRGARTGVLRAVDRVVIQS